MGIAATFKTIFAATCLLSAASLPALAASEHNVSWYLANSAQRDSILATCQADPGDLASSPDCVNAGAAEQQVVLGML